MHAMGAESVARAASSHRGKPSREGHPLLDAKLIDAGMDAPNAAKGWVGRRP